MTDLSCLETCHLHNSSRRPRFLCETLSELEHLQTTEPMSLSAAVKELDRKTSTHTDAVQRFDVVSKNGTAASGGVGTAPQNDSKAVGYHHLERLAPAQLLRMHLRLQHTLQRAGEALLFDEVCFYFPLSLSSPTPTPPLFSLLSFVLLCAYMCTRMVCVSVRDCR